MRYLYKKIISLGCLLMVFIFSGCSSLSGYSEWNELEAIESKTTGVKADTFLSRKHIGESDLVQLALLNSAELKSSFKEWKSALLKIPSSKKLPDPFFSYANYIEAVETRVGPQSQSFQIMQKFPFFGKLDAKGKIALANANQSKEKYESIKLKLIYEVKEIYYEYVYLKQSIAITEANCELLKRFEKVIQTKYKTGAAKNQDLIKIQVALGILTDRVVGLKEMEPVVLVRLNALLSLPLQSNLSLRLTLPEIDIDTLDKNNLISGLLKNNPRLNEISYKIEAAKYNISISKLNYFPDISIGATYIETDEGPLNVSDNGKDPLIVMAKVNLPIWYGALNSSRNSAKQDHLSKQNILKDTSSKLQAKLELIYYKIKNAKRKIDLYDSVLIPKANQALKITESAYKSGGVDFLSLIDAQQTILDVELDSAKAKADLAKEIAAMERLVGYQLG